MNKFDDKPNAELYTLLKEMELTHEKIKNNILKEVAKLEEVERDFFEVKDVLSKRIK